MNIYALAANRTQDAVDPIGLWYNTWRWLYTSETSDPQAEKTAWVAEKNDTLKGLAKKVSGKEDDWVCLWPVVVKHVQKPDGDWSSSVDACDVYDAENLTVKKGTTLALEASAYGGQQSLEGKTKVLLGINFLIWPETKWAQKIRDTSGQGATPIHRFYTHGHGGVENFELTSLLELDEAKKQHTYDRATKRQGPLRCWFTRSSESWFIGCNSRGFAKQFAASVLRKGAVAMGTTQLTASDAEYMYYNLTEVVVNGRHTGSWVWKDQSMDWQGAPIWEKHEGGL